MSEKRIVFCQANQSDIAGMAAIEGEFFGDYEKIYNEDFLRKWFAHNPDMFFVIKNTDDAVLGFVVLTPVTKKLHEQLLRGEIFDFFDFGEEDVCRSMNSDYYYVSDICVTKSKEINYLAAVTNAIGGMIDILSQKAKFVTACPISKAGAKLCKAIGMKKVAEADCDGQKYTICALVVDQEIISRFQRLVKKINRE